MSKRLLTLTIFFFHLLLFACKEYEGNTKLSSTPKIHNQTSPVQPSPALTISPTITLSPTFSPTNTPTFTPTPTKSPTPTLEINSEKGINPAELSVFQQMNFSSFEISNSIYLDIFNMGIVPTISDNLIGLFGDHICQVVIPEGAIAISEENPKLVLFPDGSQMIFEFVVPKSVKCITGKIQENNIYGLETGTQVVIPIKNGEIIGLPKPIAFRPDVEILVKEINQETLWIIFKDGHFIDAYHLFGSPNTKSEADIKNQFMLEGKFSNWDEVKEYASVALSGSRTYDNRPFDARKFYPFYINSISSIHGIIEGIVIGWEVVHHEQLDQDLIKIWFYNPYLNNEIESIGYRNIGDLFSAYIGFVDENGAFQDFTLNHEHRDGYQYRYNAFDKTSFYPFLTHLVGKSVQFTFLLKNNTGPDIEDPSSVFVGFSVQPGLKENWGIDYDPTLQMELALTGAYRILSEKEISKYFSSSFEATIFTKYIDGTFIGVYMKVDDIELNRSELISP